MDETELQARIHEAVYEEEEKRKLACSSAFRLADKHNVSFAEIGRICEENGIKISRCQLGCFT